MIVEMRTYTMYAGKMGEYLRLYENEGMPIQMAILGRMVGYYTTEIGTLNQAIHMWGYEDLNERVAKRAKLFQDPQWLAYVAKIVPLLQSQESTILYPTSFFKVQFQGPKA
jgi:hypothetical protein